MASPAVQDCGKPVNGFVGGEFFDELAVTLEAKRLPFFGGGDFAELAEDAALLGKKQGLHSATT